MNKLRRHLAPMLSIIIGGLLLVTVPVKVARAEIFTMQSGTTSTLGAFPIGGSGSVLDISVPCPVAPSCASGTQEAHFKITVAMNSASAGAGQVVLHLYYGAQAAGCPSTSAGFNCPFKSIVVPAACGCVAGGQMISAQGPKIVEFDGYAADIRNYGPGSVAVALSWTASWGDDY